MKIIDGALSRGPRPTLLVAASVIVVGAILIFFAVRGGRSFETRKPPPPVPVTAARVVRRDVPIFLEGLGTVQAFNTVTLKVRVDGTLDAVSFTEGQDVKAGDVLAPPLPATVHRPHLGTWP